MKEKNGSGSGIYIIAITAFFLGCFMLLIIFGTNIYRHVASRQLANNDHRAVLSYLLTATRMNEASIIRQDDPEYGTLLIVEDAGTSYGNRIYVNDGYLVEDYGRIDGELLPDYATPIGKTEIFEVEEISSSLMKVNTSQGSVFIHLRQQGEH